MRTARLQCYKHCRWCGVGYHASQPKFRDGFCSGVHKQAHYRAYKNYVTGKRPAAGKRYPRAVTRKKSKKLNKGLQVLLSSRPKGCCVAAGASNNRGKNASPD